MVSTGFDGNDCFERTFPKKKKRHVLCVREIKFKQMKINAVENELTVN